MLECSFRGMATSTQPLLRGVDFLALPIRDWEASKRFYGETLGLAAGKQWGSMPAGEFETGTVTIACTKGSAPSIGLNNGLYAGLGPTGPRAMRLGATANYLGYDIFWPGTNTSWTTAAPYIPSAPLSKAARTFNMDGAAAAGQDVAVGSYTDTVTATVNF